MLVVLFAMVQIGVRKQKNKFSADELELLVSGVSEFKDTLLSTPFQKWVELMVR